MKKLCITLSVVGLVLILGLGLLTIGNTKEGYLRIHIRANSNTSIDQNIKYMVKEGISEYLTPKVTHCKSANEAMKIVSENLTGISEAATKILEANGFNYGANAVLREEYFPTRNYGDFVLEDGYYDALIVNLGDGAGENWWCVVYPPLCFVGEGESNIKYHSLIKELFDKLLGGKK